MIKAKLKAMTEAKTREICNAPDLSGYTREECQQADQWVKDYALRQRAAWLKEGKRESTAVGDYVMLMVRCHYGSVETDEFLRTCDCYPEWLKGVRS